MPISCVLCGEKIRPNKAGWDKGHNAEPLADGRCCDQCNQLVVLKRMEIRQQYLLAYADSLRSHN